MIDLRLARDGTRATVAGIELRLIAALDTAEGRDETLGVEPPREVDGALELEWRSTRWERATTRLVEHARGIDVVTSVRGRGARSPTSTCSAGARSSRAGRAAVECDAVVIDNERGARDATSHLLAAGHRRVALLVAATNWTSDAGRLEGYRQAHAEAGVPLDERLILPVAFHEPDAQERIGALLDEQRPTAIFAANNLLAEQAWRVVRERGLRLPDDISLVGFDDVPWMDMVSPGITVVATPTDELGHAAARLFLRRVEDPDCEPAVERLEPTLVVRGSTGPLPLRNFGTFLAWRAASARRDSRAGMPDLPNVRTRRGALWTSVLAADDPTALLRERSVPRLRELAEIVDRFGRPWREAPKHAQLARDG